jgi:gluconokinase
VVGPDAVSPALAERPLVLALDIGSSSVRGAVHDRLGRTVRGSAIQVPYAWTATSDGSVRLPAGTFVDLVGDVLDGIDAAAGSLAGDVVAGGISSFIHSIVGLDGAGAPMTPVLSWADTTAASDAAALRMRIDAAAAHEATGAPVHAGYWPARVLRLRQEDPGVQRWSGLPELVLEGLTGEPVASRSMASGTGLLDRSTATWAGWLLDELDLEPARLPRLAGDDEAIGKATGSAARRWPRLSQIPWFAAWGDGGCGNVGLGATGRGKAALMVGTSGALRAVVPDRIASLPAGLFAQRLGAGTVVGGQLSEGGGTLTWVSGLLRRSQAALERAAASRQPDDHELTVLPYVFGERGLGYHDGARGAIVGLAPDTDAGSIYRAILESIAYGFAAVDDQLVGVLGAPPEIIAAGGALQRSPALVQVLADSLGRDISVARAVESSRRGAALLALAGSGEGGAASEAPAPPTTTVTSDPARAARHRMARARRDALYRTLIG